MKEIQDPPHPQPASPGSYRPGEVLGYGPAGFSCLAEHEEQPEHFFALKTLSGHPLRSSQEQEQALRDVHTLQRLRHRSILPVLEAWISEDVLYLVGPYAPGGSLQHILFSASTFPPLPLPDILTLLKQVGEALQAAHDRGIVHANVKPENILFHLEGYALLADFLLPVLAQSTLAPHPSSAFAARYMAPEQFLDEKPTARSDQYALACVICELFTGTTPCEASTFEELRARHLSEQPAFMFAGNYQPPAAFVSVLTKALAKDPEDRYPTVSTFLDALDAALTPAPAQPTSLAVASSDNMQDQTKTDPAALILPAPAHMQTSADALTSAFPPPMPTHSLVTSAAFPPTSPLSSAPHVRSRTSNSGWRVAVTTGLIVFLVLVGVLALLYPLLAPAYRSTLRATPVSNTANPTGRLATGQAPTSAPSPAATATPTGATTALPASSSSSPVQSCAVNYTVNAQWPGGFVANLKVFNSGSTPVNGWTLTFTFVNNQRVTNGWNGSYFQNGGQVSIINASYNALIAPSASVNPGFQAAWNGENPPPVAFALNGTTCTDA